MKIDLPEGYTASRISRKSLKDFIIIHRQAFKSKVRLIYAEHKFNTFPHSGIENIGYIIYYADSLPVSFYGTFPVYATMGMRKVLIAQSGDTMTVNEHTGLGLFIYSALLTHELCKENNIKGVFGFPSPSSFRTFKKKLNWKFSEYLMKFKYFIPVVPLAYIASRTRIFWRTYQLWVRFILLFYKKSDYFEGSITGNRQDGIIRDESFWHYKMLCRDNHLIKIRDIEVVFKTDGTLIIGDINLKQNTDILPIIRRLKLLAFLTFNFHLIFCTSRGTMMYEKLSKVKNGMEILPIGYLNFDEEYDLSTLKFTYFDLDTF
jgi:hypothetical protein